MSRVSIMLLFAGFAVIPSAFAQPTTEKALRPLSAEAVKAWEAAGGKVSWMGPHKEYGHVTVFDRHDDMDLTHTVPGVWFPDFDLTKLKAITPPDMPFGLHLSNKNLADKDLEVFGRFKHLKLVCLSATPVTDEGLKTVAAWKSVTHLNLFATKMGDTGVKELAKMEQMVALDLSRTAVTVAGLKELAPLKNLTDLFLLHSQLNEDDLGELAALEALRRLDLRNSNLTDGGLAKLTAVKGLTWLNVGGTKVTAAGAKAFETAIPKCKLLR